MTVKSILAMAAVLAVAGPARAAGFEFKDQAGQHLDVLADGKVAVRYMYAHDKSTPQRTHETYKPYLHVMDAEGKAPITKGPGGGYTHHRGIFIGWMKLGFEGKTYDLWGMGGGFIVHQKFTQQQAGDDQATFTSLTHWQDKAGKLILTEERTHTIRRGGQGARLTIDFTSKLQAPGAEVALNGDPEHAGVHYRPANEVVAAETVYVFPGEKADPKKDRDYPWAGETYTLAGKRYSVVQMSHADNPKGTRWSAYRDYGRFGAFPTGTVPAGGSLTLKYRFLVADGEMPKADIIQKCYDQFVGAASPSPVPPVTVRPAESKTTPKPAAPKPAKP